MHADHFMALLKQGQFRVFPLNNQYMFPVPKKGHCVRIQDKSILCIES